jgi:hypothetical protein
MNLNLQLSCHCKKPKIAWIFGVTGSHHDAQYVRLSDTDTAYSVFRRFWAAYINRQLETGVGINLLFQKA